MCGIVGLLYPDGRPLQRERFTPLLEVLAPRGPDAREVWLAPGVGLGHTRLSILDLSPNGAQPMHSLDGQLHISYNGEVYNAPQLARELQQAGHNFRGHSDTEVLLVGYQHWGLAGLLDRIRGMYAFCLVDQSTRQAHLVRDRFGKKPLYLLGLQEGAGLAFASDIRCLQHLGEPLSLDLATLDYYLCELASPQPRTIWQEIRQLPPASLLTYDLQQGSLQLRRYWEPSYRPDPGISAQAAQEETERLLRQAIRRRTLSDVPLGAFLSGGVDSGLVTALFAQESSEAIQTFTVGFDQPEFDERGPARLLAERYHTRHTELQVAPNLDQALPAVVAAAGEPFADSSALPTWLISREIGRSVKVALSGDGGDELFGGYHEYATAAAADALPSWARLRPADYGLRGLQKLLGRFGASLPWPLKHSGHLNHWLRKPPYLKFWRHMGLSPDDNRIWRMEVLEQAERDPSGEEFEHSPLFKHISQLGLHAMGPTYTHELLNDTYFENKVALGLHQDQENWTGQIFLTSLQHRLLNDYLVKLDRMSMANSLEVRSPLLDTDLAEFAFTLPRTVQLPRGNRKAVLKALAEKHVDPKIQERPKRGFSIPLNRWMRNELYDQVHETLLGERAASRGLFRTQQLQHWLRDHRAGRQHHGDLLWALMVFEIWAEQTEANHPHLRVRL